MSGAGPQATNQDGYKKVGAYSLIKGAFNVNSTSVKAWRAFLQGNKNLALESVQGTTDAGTGTPFPLGSTTSNHQLQQLAWEEFSRLTDDQIWDDNDTPSDLTDDTGLAVEIVNQVKARGPFMSFSDFVNRRIGNDSRSYQGAIQEAIEQAGINGNQSTGIRAALLMLSQTTRYYGFPLCNGSIPRQQKQCHRRSARSQSGKHPLAPCTTTKCPLRHLPHPCLWRGQGCR